MSYGKLRNREVFEAVVNGVTYTFTCYTQYCGTHVRELCYKGRNNTTETRYIKRNQVGKDIWLNRPYYRFRYENALRKGIETVAPDKETERALKAILIDKTAQDEHERCEKELKAFEEMYNKTSDSFKRAVADSDFMIQSESDVKLINGLMALDIVLNS